MRNCDTCTGDKKVKVERPYRSVPRRMRYSSYRVPVETRQLFCSKRKCSPSGCDSCYVTRDSCDPCLPAPCPDTRCYYCPGDTDSGLLHTIRNGFQRIFSTSRKRGCCEPLKGKVYNYSTSQLKCIEQYIEKLEEETSCIECTIKEAFDCDCRINCNDLRCSLTNISERLEGIRCDLLCAYDCYDPCRDKCEYDLICSLLDRVCCLEGLINDLCLQLECLEYQFNCYPASCEINCRKPCCVKRPPCKPNCKKPCCFRAPLCKVPCDPCYMPKSPKPCYRGPCDIDCCKPCCVKPLCDSNCQKPCCVKPRRWRNSRCPKPDVCRTSSVIPVGVMLVKL